jgi:SAM-dependent methyltransferase
MNRWGRFVSCTTALSFSGTVGAAVVLAAVVLNGRQPQQPPSSDPRERWNKVFAEGASDLRKQPSQLLIETVKERKPGSALDLGSGEGRNAIYLAAQGWSVTGVDISDVAVEQAKKNAAARGVEINAIVADLDEYDFGKERWDLITSFYMHSWHRRSNTDVPARIYNALKPGGIVVIEGFADPPNRVGLRADELARAFHRLRVIRNETVEDAADWIKGGKARLVRFIAEKASAGGAPPAS